jgi:hypothetical protein
MSTFHTAWSTTDGQMLPVARRKQAMVEMLERGITRGEVRADVRIEVARELGQAFLWHRFLVTGDPITPELIEHVVDQVLIPYVAPDRRPPHA